MAKLIELLFGADSVWPKELCIIWGSDPRAKGAILGVVEPIEKHGDYYCSISGSRK